MGYHQLTEGKRYQIEILLAQKKSKAEIAASIGAHRSTIYRELKRNSLEVFDEAKPIYDASPAHQIACERRCEGAQVRRRIKGDVLNYVIKKLKEESLSPEQIAGRSCEDFKELSYSSIYRYIAKDRRDIFGQSLYKYLRRYILKRRRRVKRSNAAVKYQGQKRSLRERPQTCILRSEVGHLERDLMEGVRGKMAVLVVVDRKTRFVGLEFSERNPASVHEATKRVIRRLNLRTKTITNDNGIEFIHSRLRRQELELKAPVYFCDPYSPWQRGSVENTIGLIRQYLPKKMDLSQVSEPQLRAVEKILNDRPRKILNFRTPFEIHQQTQVANSA